MKTNTKKLLMVGMATAAIVAPTSAFAQDTTTINGTATETTPATANAEKQAHERYYVEMIKPDGTLSYVHVDFITEYLTEKGYLITEEGKKQLMNEWTTTHAEGAEDLEVKEDFFMAIQMLNPEGEIRYVHSDYLNSYIADGYTLTSQGEFEVAELIKNIGQDKYNPDAADKDDIGKTPSTPDAGNGGPVGTTPPVEGEVTTGTPVEGDKEETNETPETEKPTTETPETEKPEAEKPVTETPETEKPEAEKPAVDEEAVDDDGNYDGPAFGAVGPSSPQTGDKTNETIIVKTSIETIQIKDINLTFGQENVTLDLDEHFKSNVGSDIKYEVSISTVGVQGTVAKHGDDKIVINSSKTTSNSVSTVTVLATDGESVETQTFTVTISGKNAKGGMLPQTGSEAGGIAGAVGAFLVAAGAVIAMRRRS